MKRLVIYRLTANISIFQGTVVAILIRNNAALCFPREFESSVKEHGRSALSLHFLTSKCISHASVTPWWTTTKCLDFVKEEETGAAIYIHLLEQGRDL